MGSFMPSVRENRNTDEEWVIFKDQRCGEINAEWDQVAAISEALIDLELFQSTMSTALATTGRWPVRDSTEPLICSAVNETSTTPWQWHKPVDDFLSHQCMIDAVNRGDDETVPRSPILEAPANGFPRWATKQLLKHVKFISPMAEHVSQLKQLHAEWFPILYDDYYYEAIAPSESYMRLMDRDYANFEFNIHPEAERVPNDKEITNRLFYDYRMIERVGIVLPAGSYEVEYLDDAEDPEIDETRATKVSLWQSYDRVEKRGALFNGARKLKRIVLEEDVVIGFICARLSPYGHASFEDTIDERLFLQFMRDSNPHRWEDAATTKDKTAYIMSFGLADAWRGLGLARHLFNEFVRRVEKRNISSLVLHVITHNVSAIRFYERNNFRSLCVVDDFYHICGLSWRADALCLSLSTFDHAYEVANYPNDTESAVKNTDELK